VNLLRKYLITNLKALDPPFKRINMVLAEKLPSGAIRIVAYLARFMTAATRIRFVASDFLLMAMIATEPLVG